MSRDGNPLSLYFVPCCFRGGVKGWAQARLLIVDVKFIVLGFGWIQLLGGVSWLLGVFLQCDGSVSGGE